MEIVSKILSGNGLITAFLVVAILYKLSDYISKYLTKGKVASSAIAIILGLVLAYVGGIATGGSKGIADVAVFSGFATFGGAMFRDFAIVSTAYGADVGELKRCGFVGIFSLLFGVTLSFVMGIIVAYMGGYTNAAELATIGAGAVTFVAGPVTGSALGVGSDIIAISIGMGVVKSIAVMILTPSFAKVAGLNTPKAALIYGGIMGTTSGTAAGMAAVNPKLVPYCAMTATFYTGLGCLLCPSVLYMLTKLVFGG